MQAAFLKHYCSSMITGVPITPARFMVSFRSGDEAKVRMSLMSFASKRATTVFGSSYPYNSCNSFTPAVSLAGL